LNVFFSEAIAQSQGGGRGSPPAGSEKRRGEKGKTGRSRLPQLRARLKAPEKETTLSPSSIIPQRDGRVLKLPGPAARKTTAQESNF